MSIDAHRQHAVLLGVSVVDPELLANAQVPVRRASAGPELANSFLAGHFPPDPASMNAKEKAEQRLWAERIAVEFTYRYFDELSGSGPVIIDRSAREGGEEHGQGEAWDFADF